MIEKLIITVIENEVENADAATRFRKPVTGFAEVKNDDFKHIRNVVGEHHISPGDLLPGARSLVAFFLPFSKCVVNANLKNKYVARDWAVAYVETNKLIRKNCESVVRALGKAGIEASYEQPTYDFDKKKLAARWSHRSVAKLTGIGSFGLNRLLITDAGCTGRFGSLVIGTKPGSVPAEQKRMPLFLSLSCKMCIDRCPVNAKKRRAVDRGHVTYLQKHNTFLIISFNRRLRPVFGRPALFIQIGGSGKYEQKVLTLILIWS
jgi:epoxyqueuosine reductase QueG